MDIGTQRLKTQHVGNNIFKDIVKVVDWLGAVQAQEYAGAKWALALRCQGATDNLVEKSFNKGDILRTHVMRPTWHFVMPQDIRWLLQLTGPHVQKLQAYYCKKLELDEISLNNCADLIAHELQGGHCLPRTALVEKLYQAGIKQITHNNTVRIACIMMHAELKGLICSGPRIGKHFTYALLDERVAPTPPLTIDEALSKLTYKYFASHGPATLQDYMWWSGLSALKAKQGIALVGNQLQKQEINGQIYWFQEALSQPGPAPDMYLLPAFDEFTISYKDRSAVFPIDYKMPAMPGSGSFIVQNAKVIGTWKRELKNSQVVISYASFQPFTNDQRAALMVAAQQYADYLEKELIVANPHQSRSNNKA